MNFARFLPIAAWLPDYDRSWFTSDLIAGLTVWALVVPQSIAYAQIAGLPPQAGIFVSFAAPLGYALFGTSRQLVCSPTSATAAISAALVAPVVVDHPEDYAAMSAALAILCGIAFFVLGKLKLGFVSQFIASAVQTGFLFGLGLTIIIGQLFKVFGFGGINGPFYKQAWHFLRHIGDTNGWTLLIGGGAFIAVTLLGRSVPKLPAALIMVALSIVIVSVFDLTEKGVAVVGTVDRAFPTPALPIVDLGALLTLVPGALAIVVVGYSESISVAKRFADEHHYQIRPDQELTALGFSSALGGIFQGFISGGGASQSAANDRAGAKTQMSSIVLALLAALTSILLMPLFKNLPLAVLSAIVINAVMGFVNLPALRHVRALRRDSFVLALLAMIGVLMLGILAGLLIAVAISIVLMLSRIGRPSVSEVVLVPDTSAVVAIAYHPELAVSPSLLVLRPDFPLLFANASWIRDRVVSETERAEPRVVVLDLETTHSLDLSSLETLESIQRDLADRGTELWLSNVHTAVREMLERSRVVDRIGRERVFATVADATRVFEQLPESDPPKDERGGDR
ncbi:MAG TPA: SulP family inorganic anion transporter [Thermomicrobiales bacterium]|nr:SulP family inorganic anion transporter [Thermomicrobiales bacterium]